MLQHQSSFPVRQRNARRSNVAATNLGLLHDVLTGGFVRAEPGRERQMLPASRRRQGVSSAHPQWHQGFDQTFAQGPRSGVEADSHHEQQISTGEESACWRRSSRYQVVHHISWATARVGL